MTIRHRVGMLAACALGQSVWGNGLKVSAVIGTLLNMVNQGPALLAGHDVNWIGLAFNYVIPFCVSVYSGACVVARERRE